MNAPEDRADVLLGLLRNMLAVIDRDGGHRQARDADIVVSVRRAETEIRRLHHVDDDQAHLAERVAIEAELPLPPVWAKWTEAHDANVRTLVLEELEAAVVEFGYSKALASQLRNRLRGLVHS
jgi:hypothetical protein